jgi:hypothetical protein
MSVLKKCKASGCSKYTSKIFCSQCVAILPSNLRAKFIAALRQQRGYEAEPDYFDDVVEEVIEAIRELR